MSGAGARTLVLAGPDLVAEPGAVSGRYRLDLAEEASGLRYDLLDAFDQPVRQAKAALLEAGGALMLFRDADAPLIQAGEACGRRAADIAGGPVAAWLAALSPLRAFLPVARGALCQRRYRLLDDEEKTVARATLYAFEPEGELAPLAVWQVEALRGYRKPFEALLAALRADSAEEARACDLYRFLCPGLVPYEPKPRIPLGQDETAFETAADIIRAQLAVARINEPGIIADHDTEFLHDYRIALRKVRSVVSLFRGVHSEPQTAALKTAFSELMAPTGRLRDLDVYLLDRERYFGLLPETLRDGLAIMFDLFAAERAEAQARLAAWLQSAAYREKIGSLGALFDDPGRLDPGPNAERPAHDYAAELIWTRYRKLCKTARAIDADTPDEEVHRLRIHGKKLRYLMEFFAPLFPEKQMKSLIRPLKKLQDTLGRFNDYSVQQAALQAFITQHATRGRKQDLAVATSIGALITVLHQRQIEARAEVADRFRHFDSAPVQRTFRALFHEKDG